MKPLNQKCFLFSFFLIFILFLTISCKEDSNPVDADVQIQTTKNISPKEGGTLELTSSAGDKIILTIPKYALGETKSVTLQLLNKTEANPFSNNLINTIRILPDGLKLRHAAQLKIIFNNAITDTSRTILYCRKASDFAIPLAKKDITNNSITSEMYHFSDYGGSKPSNQEIIEQSNKANTSFVTDLMDWQSFSDLVKGILGYIELLQAIGEDQLANQLLESLEQKIIDHVNAFLDLPIPDDPCGYYQQALFKYGEMAQLLTSNQQLINRVGDRIMDIRNRCFIRGELEYDHYMTFSAGGGTINRTIKGFVPFIVNTYNEPYGEISGNGTVNWNGIEQSVCIGTETVIGNVILSGEMESDNVGYPWLNFEMNETWAGSVTVVCPNGSVTYPLNPPPSSSAARFLMEDGYTVVQPSPVGSGQFKWVLHIQFQP